MMKRIAVVLTLVASSVLVGSQAQSEVSAQAGEVAWYRIVKRGRSAGTMPRWMRVDRGAAATIPFMENFEVSIVPTDGLVNALIRDGQAEFMATIGCTHPRAPRRAAITATRSGADQPVVTVTLECSVTEPPVR